MKKVHISLTETLLHSFEIECSEEQADELLAMGEWSDELNELLGDITHSKGHHITVSDGSFEDGEVTLVKES